MLRKQSCRYPWFIKQQLLQAKVNEQHTTMLPITDKFGFPSLVGCPSLVIISERKPLFLRWHGKNQNDSQKNSNKIPERNHNCQRFSQQTIMVDKERESTDGNAFQTAAAHEATNYTYEFNWLGSSLFQQNYSCLLVNCRKDNTHELFELFSSYFQGNENIPSLDNGHCCLGCNGQHNSNVLLEQTRRIVFHVFSLADHICPITIRISWDSNHRT